MHEYARSTRKKIIQDLRVRHARRGELGFPPDDYLKLLEKENADEVWTVYTTTRTGLMPSQISIHHVFSAKEADEILQKYPKGTEIEDTDDSSDMKRNIVQTTIDSGFPFGISAGDRESPLAFDVLAAVGIYERNYGPISHKVIEGLGEERLKFIRQKFPENWESVAIYEYCFVNFPHSSAAFMAASYQYHYYITEDDFSAGYFWRDLEVIVLGVEAEAAKAIETRIRAGGAGGKTSRNSREKRRSDLLDKIEALAAQNPAIVQFSEEAVAKVVLDDCVRDNPNLWKQGKGQLNDYLGEIRRGEAGDDMKARFEALFGSKPPKRLG